jgi:leucyl aminopeptidase
MGLGEEAACANPPAVGLGLKIGASLAKLADQEKGCQSCLVYLPEPLMSSESFLRDCASSLFYSLYSDNRYRTGKSIVWPAMGMMHLYFAPSHGGAWDRSHFDPFIQEGIQLARGQYLAMDIVNAPHNVLNSLSLANEALHLADTSKNLVCKILNKDDCEARGMGAYLAVARGSETPPQFIHLTYTPRGEIKRKVAVVGKGLLFDTGGYNIKVSGMELMKFDCGGAAAVLGAAKAIDALDIPGVEVHFIVAACENMISAKAYVASDVLVASNGKTIEVVNTDAEGRLTLADALVYADKEIGCDKIIELSTLTGACMISLGKSMAGLWTNSDELAAELNEASKATNEKTWRMPMATEYKDQLESKIADMTNCGTRYGGAITAALFLQNFIEGDKPFSHIDIAGPVWHDKKGATGFGVKLITEWCRIQGQQ